jgi:hypothetical protein
MPGHKEAYRLYSSDGRALIDLLQLPDEEPPQVAQFASQKAVLGSIQRW